MKSALLIVLLAVLSACAHSGALKAELVEIQSSKSLNQSVITSVLNTLEKSPTFMEFKEKGNKPVAVIEEEDEGFVWLWLYSESKDRNFRHRWAILKVELGTGKVFKLGTDANLEDKWWIDYEPKK
jgi:hypothetical protein